MSCTIRIIENILVKFTKQIKGLLLIELMELSKGKNFTGTFVSACLIDYDLIVLTIAKFSRLIMIMLFNTLNRLLKTDGFEASGLLEKIV